MTKIETLVDDIYKLFDPKHGHEVNEENLEQFANNIKELVRLRLAMREEKSSPLRFSALGTPDRKLWYAAQGGEQEELNAKTYFKFLYGDVIEQLVLFLAKESGHEVTHEQEEVSCDGVLGHIDAIIDGVVVDVKSASPYGFQKFKNNEFIEDDPFGYVPQISGYANVLTPRQGAAFLAFDKVSGELCLSPVSATIVGDFDLKQRIEHQKEVIALPEPPERCYPDVEDGKSGNRKLGTECSYCVYKKECWPGLRTFLYSSGPKYLTNVVRVPDVYEVA